MRELSPLRLTWMLIGLALLGAEPLRALPLEGGYAPQAHREHVRGYRRLPGGSVPYYYGGYRYYRIGGAYFTPFMYQGRTVYVRVGSHAGNPVPPPPSASIDVDFY